MRRAHRPQRRATLGAIGITCAALAASVVFAAAGKPGNFKPAPTSPETFSGNRAELVVAAKLDDEPGTDLALVNSFDSVAVLSGKGNGNFGQIDRAEGVGSGPGVQITAADLDGENGTDLAVSSFNFITIFLNDGSGEFTEPATSPEDTGINNGGITSANFDGDDDIDLVTGNVQDPGSGLVLLNDGDGDFTAGDSFSAPATYFTKNADLDGDGDRDVVTLDVQAETARVAFNDGDGNLTDTQALTGGGGGSLQGAGIAVGRIDGGPSPDIAVGMNNPGEIDVFLNDGDGGFSPSPRSPLGAGRYFGDVHIGDVDGDGRNDLLAGEAPTSGDRAVAVFLSRRGGRFKEPETSPEAVADGNDTPWLAGGRFDRGKSQDIAAANGDLLSILLNRSP